jgi:hypothetical protein
VLAPASVIVARATEPAGTDCKRLWAATFDSERCSALPSFFRTKVYFSRLSQVNHARQEVKVVRLESHALLFGLPVAARWSISVATPPPTSSSIKEAPVALRCRCATTPERDTPHPARTITRRSTTAGARTTSISAADRTSVLAVVGGNSRTDTSRLRARRNGLRRRPGRAFPSPARRPRRVGGIPSAPKRARSRCR